MDLVVRTPYRGPHVLDHHRPDRPLWACRTADIIDLVEITSLKAVEDDPYCRGALADGGGDALD
jgi:hypothetical protein